MGMMILSKRHLLHYEWWAAWGGRRQSGFSAEGISVTQLVAPHHLASPSSSAADARLVLMMLLSLCCGMFLNLSELVAMMVLVTVFAAMWVTRFS